MAAQPMMVGTPTLLVIDIQADSGMPVEVGGIPRMEGNAEVVANAEALVAAARSASVPIIFFQEVHRRSGVDFGRELDGAEGPHCIEGEPSTELWPTLRPEEGEYFIPKRRYSGFYGTELEILLRGLGTTTLLLCGGLTDVCVHYTFADAHQRDFFVRVAQDAVIGSSLEAHNASLLAMEYLQTGARRSTRDLVAGLCSHVSEMEQMV